MAPAGGRVALADAAARGCLARQRGFRVPGFTNDRPKAAARRADGPRPPGRAQPVREIPSKAVRDCPPYAKRARRHGDRSGRGGNLRRASRNDRPEAAARRADGPRPPRRAKASAGDPSRAVRDCPPYAKRVRRHRDRSGQGGNPRAGLHATTARRLHFNAPNRDRKKTVLDSVKLFSTCLQVPCSNPPPPVVVPRQAGESRARSSRIATRSGPGVPAAWEGPRR